MRTLHINLRAVMCMHFNIICVSSVWSSGSVKCVMEEGMPTYRNPFQKGNLYVKFEITFPPNKFANENQLKVRRTCRQI